MVLKECAYDSAESTGYSGNTILFTELLENSACAPFVFTLHVLCWKRSYFRVDEYYVQNPALYTSLISLGISRMTTKKNMIFTSAGDNTNFIKWWCSNEAEYDIYVVYYGNSEANFLHYSKHVTHIERGEGSKFQNFCMFYNKYPDTIAKYDRFFILDDDIEISAPDINYMFSVSREYNLSICGPSFSKDSKISFQITKHNPKLKMAYTNFVEVNTPLFDKQSLQNTMKCINSKLIGWGIDYLYIWANGLQETTKYAIVHSVSCCNPPIRKNGQRELNLLKDVEKRSEIWKAYAKEIGCPHTIVPVEYKTLPRV